MAREVLDVQRYPDLRQYPGGPPERPYDAAGWSLPLQMGVRVVPATSPAGRRGAEPDETPRPPPDVKIKPTTYEAHVKLDATPFDSLPGIGFDTDPASAAIVPPPGSVTGIGPGSRGRSGAEQRLQGDQPGMAPGRLGAARAAARRFALPSRGCPSGAQDDLVKSLALQAERTASAPARAIRQPRIGLYQPWSGSMGEGWTRWVFEQYGFAVRHRPPRGLSGAARAESRRARSSPTMRGCRSRRAAGGAARQGRVAAGRGAIRPEYAYQLTAGDLERFEQFVRGGGTVVCVSNASGFAIQQLKLPVSNVVAGLEARGVLPARLDRRGHDRSVAPGDGRHARQGGDLRRRQPGLRDAGRLQGQGAGALSGRRFAAAAPAISSARNYLHGKAAALDVQLDAGHVVLLGFRPEWRGQPFGTFRVLFNAALFGR